MSEVVDAARRNIAVGPVHQGTGCLAPPNTMQSGRNADPRWHSLRSRFRSFLACLTIAFGSTKIEQGDEVTPPVYPASDLPTKKDPTYVARTYPTNQRVTGSSGNALAAGRPAYFVVLGVVSATLLGCSPQASPPTTPAPSPTSASSEYREAIENYPRALPDGYRFPDALPGGETAVDTWWWCATVSAAWHSYFDDTDEASAMGYLELAATNPPDELPEYKFGFDGHTTEVKFANGGVDSAWLEGIESQCQTWAETMGRRIERAQ